MDTVEEKMVAWDIRAAQLDAATRIESASWVEYLTQLADRRGHHLTNGDDPKKIRIGFLDETTNERTVLRLSLLKEGFQSVILQKTECELLAGQLNVTVDDLIKEFGRVEFRDQLLESLSKTVK